MTFRLIGIGLISIFLFGCQAIGFTQQTEVSQRVPDQRLNRFDVENAEARNAVCNDGTPAVFYGSQGSGEDQSRWIISLEGGGGCFDLANCQQRAQQSPGRVSSRSYGATVTMNGIFVSDTSVNPDFANWNQIFIKYCSSDFWAGSRDPGPDTDGFHFRGHDIIMAVLEDLQDLDLFGNQHLGIAEEVIFMGTSAGAAGVVANLDSVADALPWARVSGLIDSIVMPGLALLDTRDELIEMLADRIIFQGLLLDETCQSQHDMPALCVNAFDAVSYLETPHFILTDQRDNVLLRNLRQIGGPQIEQQIQSILQTTAPTWSGAYIPNRGVHVWTRKDLFYTYTIDGATGMDVFSNWYFDRPGPTVVVEQ